MNIIFALISGMMLGFSFPGILFPLAFFALVPFFYSIDRCKNKIEAFICGIVFGAAFCGCVFSFIYTLDEWVGGLIYLGLVGLSIFLSLYYGLFAIILKALIHKLKPFERVLIIPLVWIFIEWLRSLGPFGITPAVGYSQWHLPFLIQISSATGVAGISFLLVFSNAVFYEMIGKPLKIKLQYFSLLFLIFAAVSIFGIFSLGRDFSAGAEKKVVIVQGNHSEKEKIELSNLASIEETYLSLTKSSANLKPDVVVWPETAIPYYIQLEPLFISRLCFLMKSMNALFIIGAPRLDEHRNAYNSSAVFSGEGRFLGWQDKHNLVPFGEYMPFRNLLVPLFTFLGQTRYTEFLVKEFNSSRRNAPIETELGKVGIMICVDSFFPQTPRRYILDGAKYLFVITNDAWFKRSQAIFKHTAAAVFRAVENRSYIVQASNNGISVIVDPCGRIIARSSFFKREILAGSIKEIKTLSFYTRFGDAFTYLCLLVLFGFALHLKISRRV